MAEKVSNSVLVQAGLKIMANNGMPLVKLPSKGRAMLYKRDNGETVRVRTCNDHILIAVADSPELNAKLNIEGTDWLLIVMPEEPRTPGNVLAYLVPTRIAVQEVRDSHRRWLESNPKTKGENTTWNLWFAEDGPEKACGYAKKWEQYCLKGDASALLTVPPKEKNNASSVRAEVEAARNRIAKVAGVPPEAVRISIDFHF